MTVLPPRSNSNNNRGGGTTAWQAFISLLKGYVGPGCLSLPWAISQLGLVVGTMSVLIVSYWTSINIWHVVELKRAYQDELLLVLQEEAAEETNNNNHTVVAATTTESPPHNHTSSSSSSSDHHHHPPDNNHDENDETTTMTHAFPHQQQHSPPINIITYPDVGNWLYGKRFARFLTSMICIQQIAVCTVFMSFIGENLGAALEHSLGLSLNHAMVITIGALPSAILLTTCLSNLKVLAPIMTVATITLFAGFAVLFVLVFEAWPQRPRPYLVEVQDWQNVPLAICAILYSFEGICLILPIETSMTHSQQFGMVFGCAMAASAIIFAMVASLCVMSFGRVSSGSITAFLVEQQESNGEEKEGNLEILNMANLLVSIAVLLTYPLQLFPSYELVGPAVAKYFSSTSANGIMGGAGADETIIMEENGYVAANSDDEGGGGLAGDSSATIPAESPFSDEDIIMEQASPPPPPSRNSVVETVPIAAAATDSAADASYPETSYWNYYDYYGTSYGDTPAVRVGLVLVTYLFAIVVPNVQLLVSLAGAVSGSATGLLVPPLLQLAHWKRMEQRERQQQLQEEAAATTASASSPRGVAYGSWHYQQRRMQCYILFILGCIVLVIGTTSSLWDIIKVYRGVG